VLGFSHEANEEAAGSEEHRLHAEDAGDSSQQCSDSRPLWQVVQAPEGRGTRKGMVMALAIRVRTWGGKNFYLEMTDGALLADAEIAVDEFLKQWDKLTSLSFVDSNGMPVLVPKSSIEYLETVRL
jgi:hypothetical protein